MKKLVLMSAIAGVIAGGAVFAGGVANAQNQQQAAASTQDSNGMYATVLGGVAIPSGKDNKDMGLKTGFNGGVAAGYQFGQFKAEGEFAYLRNGSKNDKKFHLNQYVGMANVIYDIPLHSSIVPYIGAGAGIDHIKSNEKSDKGTNAFAYQGIAGVGYNVSQNVMVGVDYRLLGAYKGEDKSKKIDSTKLYNNTVNATVSYHF